MLVSKDGTLRYVSASTAPIKSSDREIMGVVVVFRDITRIRKAEEKLQKLSQAVEQSPGIIVMADTRGNIEYVNPRFTEVTGYSFDEVKRKSLFFMELEENGEEKCKDMIQAVFQARNGEVKSGINQKTMWYFGNMHIILR